MNKNKILKPKNTSYYNSQTILREAIIQAIEKRKKEKGKCSLGDFSKLTDIPKQHLSEFLNHKREFKKKIVSKKLKSYIPKKTLIKFIKEHDFEKSISFENKPRPDSSVDVFSIDKKGNQYLNKDQEAFTRDPYCYVLLVAFDLENFEPNIDWFIDKIDLKKNEIFKKLELLARLKLIDKKNGFYTSSGRRPNTISYHLNKAFKKFHEGLVKIQLNHISSRGLQYIFSEWFFSPIDQNDFDDFMVELKALTRKFHQKQLSSKPKKIYAFNLNFFPVGKS